MPLLAESLRSRSWGLLKARSLAHDLLARPRQLRKLMTGDEPEVRKRAADVTRRISDVAAAPLYPYADELVGLLEAIPPDEPRTRWHLGLVVPRVSHTHPQRLRAARIMLLLAEDESNAVRCSAVEGLAVLALAESTFREDAEAVIESFLRKGTPAMKSRARHARTRLRKRYGDF